MRRTARSAVFGAIVLPPCFPSRLFGILPRMDTKEIQVIVNTYHQNLNNVLECSRPTHSLEDAARYAMMATIVDVLREGQSHPEQSDEVMLAGRMQEVELEALKKLGALGLQDIQGLQGYRVADGKVLLKMNGRLADTGWDEGDGHLDALKTLAEGAGVQFVEV